MFTNEELDMLMSALDALEKQDVSDNLLGMMLGGLVSRNPEDAKDYMEKQNKKFKEGETARRQIKERIVVLKAKLIGMHDSIVVNDMVGEVLK